MICELRVFEAFSRCIAWRLAVLSAVRKNIDRTRLS